MSQAPRLEILTPVGRLVQGHPMEKQDKDHLGQPLTTRAGEPAVRYFVAVAIAKNDPAWPALWATLNQAARGGFPTLFDAQGNCLSRDFAWKVADGDATTVSRPGEKPNASKEGFAGHWILKFSSGFPIKTFYAGRYAPHEQLQDEKLIKRGYYVRVFGSVQGNNNSQKPGIYVNPSMLELVALGEEIVSGPDAAAAFGAAPAAALPAGAMPLPGPGAAPAGNGFPPAMQPAVPGLASPPVGAIAPAMPMAHGAPIGAQPAAAFPSPPGVPTMSAQPPAASVPVQPHHGILAGPGTAAPPAMTAPGLPPMMAPAPAAAPIMVPAAPQLTAHGQAQGFTIEQWRMAGYSDDALRSQGIIA